MNDLVSIIIPVYNSETTIDRCVKSLQSQTYRSIEILLIDDGSTDQSGAICDRYAENDPRVKVFHGQNYGASHARNIGIKNAKGMYLTFVDSDDYVDASMIECLLNDLKRNNSELSVSCLETELRKDFCISLNSDYEDEILFLCERYLIFGPTQKMYISKIAKETPFLEKVRYGEDLLFNLDYLNKICSLSFTNKCFYHYCRKEGSLSTKVRWDMFDNDMSLHRALEDWFCSLSLKSTKSKKFISNRVLDTAINSICLTFRKDWPRDLQETEKYIRTIVEDKMVRDSIKDADTGKYAAWQIKAVSKKNVKLLNTIAVLKRAF